MSHQLRSGEKSSKAFGLEMKEHPSCIGTRGYKNTMGILPFQRLNDLDSKNLTHVGWGRWGFMPPTPLAGRILLFTGAAADLSLLRFSGQRGVISVVPNRALNQASLPKPRLLTYEVVGMCDKFWSLRLQNQKTTTMCPAFSIVGCHVLMKMFLITILEVWKSSRPNKVAGLLGWFLEWLSDPTKRQSGPTWTSCGYIVPAQMLGGGFQMLF